MLTFCNICDHPIPVAMTHEETCAACWAAHAIELDQDADPNYQRAAVWARANEAAARGPLLLEASHG